MPCRNLRVLSSPRCVLGPPQTDFANSSWVARYPGSNSLGHLYIAVCNNDPTGLGKAESFSKQGRKTVVCGSISIDSDVF